MQFSGVEFISIVGPWEFRTLASCKTEASFTSSPNFPFSLPSGAGNHDSTFHFQECDYLDTLYNWCKWNATGFVFLWLPYFTYFNILKVQPLSLSLFNTQLPRASLVYGLPASQWLVRSCAQTSCTGEGMHSKFRQLLSLFPLLSYLLSTCVQAHDQLGYLYSLGPLQVSPPQMCQALSKAFQCGLISHIPLLKFWLVCWSELAPVRTATSG